MAKNLKPDAPTRSVSDVGKGDYIAVADGHGGNTWKQITSNPAEGETRPRNWSVETDRGTHGMMGINRYAKAEDLKD